MCLLERVAVDGSQINVGPSLWLRDVPTEIYYREKMRSPSSGGGEDLILLSANTCAAPDRRNWLERHLFEDEDQWVTKVKPRLELVGFFALDYAQRRVNVWHWRTRRGTNTRARYIANGGLCPDSVRTSDLFPAAALSGAARAIYGSTVASAAFSTLAGNPTKSQM
jgi:hypothetical protein